MEKEFESVPKKEKEGKLVDIEKLKEEIRKEVLSELKEDQNKERREMIMELADDLTRYLKLGKDDSKKDPIRDILNIQIRALLKSDECIGFTRVDSWHAGPEYKEKVSNEWYLSKDGSKKPTCLGHLIYNVRRSYLE